ncbi:hypothetical protein FISHEDRAFT_71015 [Fistulina hepatica ATCC 64428]|uniref:Uncharacterized protein n=1 Tax=Fistulina hepatica ATCC 64428 TaxID=1128425 RepID=A0A0D7AJB9_9AGAR|nr:hypothetical protein FISHEDRAFT_71015 [Fistulina hepatica ATCC 64428]
MSSLAIARVYQRTFEARPNITLAVTGGILNAVGDAAAQFTQKTLSEDGRELRGYDFRRTLRFFIYGFALSPLVGRWNVLLERRFPLRKFEGSGRVSLRALSKRVACDQLVWAPVGLGAFIGSMGIMEGRNASQITERFRDLYIPALITNWQVWPLAQLINFRFMPLPYRVPFSSFCGIFWTLYLSLLNSREDAKQDQVLALQHTLEK